MAGFDRFNRARAGSAAAWKSGDVDISELLKLTRDLRSAGEDIGPKVVIATKKTGYDITRTAKVYAPVDTGFLRSSIGPDFDSDGLGVTVGPAASYGAFPEYGTSTQRPQPYMGPAADRHVPEYVAALDELAGGIL